MRISATYERKLVLPISANDRCSWRREVASRRATWSSSRSCGYSRRIISFASSKSALRRSAVPSLMNLTPGLYAHVGGALGASAHAYGNGRSADQARRHLLRVRSLLGVITQRQGTGRAAARSSGAAIGYVQETNRTRG